MQLPQNIPWDALFCLQNLCRTRCLWAVASCYLVKIYRRFGPSCRSHLLGSKKNACYGIQIMEGTRRRETSVYFNRLTPRNNPETSRPHPKVSCHNTLSWRHVCSICKVWGYRSSVAEDSSFMGRHSASNGGYLADVSKGRLTLPVNTAWRPRRLASLCLKFGP